MSDKALERIEKALKKLSKQQEAICEKLERLEQLERRAEAGGSSAAASTDEVIGFLDQFRAGEALGEASLGAWIEVSTTPCVKGALRTIQMREASHAQLLEQRIKELGGSPTAEVPQAIYDAAMESLASTEKSDIQKLQEFMSRFTDIDATLKPIHDLADRLDHDQETQSLLRTIVQDERSTLEFLNEACQQLSA